MDPPDTRSVGTSVTAVMKLRTGSSSNETNCLNHTFRLVRNCERVIAVNLVRATQFDEGSKWRGTLVPAAGEMSAYFGRQSRAPMGHQSLEPDSEKNLRDSFRRAQKRIRQTAVSSRLNCLLTLTFAEEPLRIDVVAALTAKTFRRALYRIPRFPYIWTVEKGSEGGRLHVHALISESSVENVKRAWDLGLAQVRSFPLDSESLRTAASYLSKDLESMLVHNGQSYRIAKGFKPESLRLPSGLDRSTLIRFASDEMGASPFSIYESSRYPAITALWEV